MTGISARRAFTLLELLAVMGIMGLMGATAVGGYRAMQRNMEERGVVQNVNTAIRAAYQRAQIDRQPVFVIFWNETTQEDSDSSFLSVHGHLVAVRRCGRFSDVSGQYLIDEFADLDKTYTVIDGSTSGDQYRYIYPVEEVSKSSAQYRSTVLDGVVKKNETPLFLFRQSGTGGSQVSSSTTAADEIPRYAFKVEDAGNVSWKRGMAYGMEFISLDLPNGYIFGTTYSKSVKDPVKDAGAFAFDVGANSMNGLTKGGVQGNAQIEINAVRQDGTGYRNKSLGQTQNPEKES